MPALPPPYVRLRGLLHTFDNGEEAAGIYLDTKVRCRRQCSFFRDPHRRATGAARFGGSRCSAPSTTQRPDLVSGLDERVRASSVVSFVTGLGGTVVCPVRVRTTRPRSQMRVRNFLAGHPSPSPLLAVQRFVSACLCLFRCLCLGLGATEAARWLALGPALGGSRSVERRWALMRCASTPLQIDLAAWLGSWSNKKPPPPAPSPLSPSPQFDFQDEDGRRRGGARES